MPEQYGKAVVKLQEECRAPLKQSCSGGFSSFLTWVCHWGTAAMLAQVMGGEGLAEAEAPAASPNSLGLDVMFEPWTFLVSGERRLSVQKHPCATPGQPGQTVVLRHLMVVALGGPSHCPIYSLVSHRYVLHFHPQSHAFSFYCTYCTSFPLWSSPLPLTQAANIAPCVQSRLGCKDTHFGPHWEPCVARGVLKLLSHSGLTLHHPGLTQQPALP